MLRVVAGERTNAVRAQEFFLIEHARQDSAQPYRIHQRNDPAFAIAEMAQPGWVNSLHQFRHPSHAFPQSFQCSGYPFALPGFNHSGGTERQQTDHGADFEPRCTAVGKSQDIVVESIFFIPHTIWPHLIHGASDPQEMAPKFDRHVFEGGIVSCQLDADLEHVLAKQRYPRRAVSLLEMATRGQLRAAIEYTDVVQSKKAPLKQVLA